MLIRVRSNVGVWRVDGLDEKLSTLEAVMQKIAETRPHVVYTQPLSADPACSQPFDVSQPLHALGLRQGSMVHCRVDPSTCADQTMADVQMDGEDVAMTAVGDGEKQHMRRVIGKDGSIKLVPTNETSAGQDKGFRKGMMPLRDMKMQWTLADFVALDSQFEFKIKRQESAICKQVSLDVPSISDFQAYVQRFSFRRKRFGYLYGKFVKVEADDEAPTKAVVEAIYEPPQEHDSECPEGFRMLEDAEEERVEQIATMLGLRRVGWVFCHEPRKKGKVLTTAELLTVADFQLEAADGVNETPFVTVTVFPTKDGAVSVEAFQVSQQCMAMAAEQALELDEDDFQCKVSDTFTAIQEGKESKTVDNNFFLCVVPISQHTSDNFVAEFPRCNREIDERVQSHDEMKKQLQKAGSAGWTFEDRLSDFNLLVYLSRFLDMNADFPKICASLSDRKIPLDDGFKLIIKSMAGMEGSY